MRFIAIVLFIGFYSILAQDIPSERLNDWSNVGVQSSQQTEVNVYDFVSIRNHQSLTDDETMSHILNILANGYNEIYFKNGSYNFTKPIIISDSTSLKGESSESTILNFDLEGKNHLISSIGVSNKDTIYIDKTLELGTKIIEVENHNIKSGDIIYIFDEDSDKVTSKWAKWSTGQIIEIEFSERNSIILKSSLRRNFQKENKPRLITLNLISAVSISDITINRLDQTESQTSNIYFEYVHNASVSCVKSFKSNFAHITIANSLNCEITGSYFQDGFDYGGGGKAYGVMLQFATSECLVYNNQFNHLRHSMILQAGANGNVISYNYSKDPFWTDVTLPANSAGDLVLHGNYPYSNLFEGNTVQHIVIDDSHGQNGKYNTFLRNRAELYGLFMNPGTPSNSQNFIGNEITNSGFLMGNYFLSGNDHFEYGNNIKGNIIPADTKDVSLKSLYLENKLEYYNEDWPPIGLPNKIEANKIEAENSNINNYLTACDYILSYIKTDFNEINIFVYPNPIYNSDMISIKMEKKIGEIKIYDLLGNVLHDSFYENDIIEIDISQYHKGLYFIETGSNFSKFIIE